MIILCMAAMVGTMAWMMISVVYKRWRICSDTEPDPKT